MSPSLAWSNVPRGTRDLAIIVDDPDVRGWTHWNLYNIPSDLTELPEAVSSVKGPPDGWVAGVNDFKRLGYGGPCPPRGAAHHYRFNIYALGAELALDIGASKDEFLRAMEGHILASGGLTGMYRRK